MFGLLTTDGRRMFRQHDRFDMCTFARFPRAAVHRFGRICMTLDNAPLHHAKTIRQLVNMIDGLTLKFRPAATPEISAIEPYWKELKRRMFDVQHSIRIKDPDKSSKKLLPVAGKIDIVCIIRTHALRSNLYTNILVVIQL